MIRRTLVMAVPLGVLALGGCGGGSTPTTPTASPTPSTAPVITFTLKPAEGAPSETSTDPGYQYSASFTLTLTETAGVAVLIRSVNANLQQASGGIVVTPPAGLSEAFRYQIRSPGNQVAANGSISIDFTFYYTLPQPGQEALVTVNFTVVDTAGNVYTQTTQVKVV